MEVESSGNNHVKDFEDGPVAKKTKVEGRYVDQDRCQLDLASDLGKICIADDITFEIVWNDKSNESCCKLIALKNIFSRQLPKMPKVFNATNADVARLSEWHKLIPGTSLFYFPA